MIVRNALENKNELRHGIADAAGVASHASNGQPLPLEVRMKTIPPEVKAAIIEELNGGIHVA